MYYADHWAFLIILILTMANQRMLTSPNEIIELVNNQHNQSKNAYGEACYSGIHSVRYDWSVKHTGKPGSGKATVCHRLAQRHDISYVTIGQLLRDEASTSTTRGRTLAQYVYAEPAKTVPKALLMEIMKETISRLLYVHRPIVISGFPKNYEQAMELENLGLPIKHLIYLNILNETAKARIQRKNQYCEVSPISAEGVERRLTTFDQHTLPVIQLLDKEKRVWEIDANGDSESLFKQVDELYTSWLRCSKQGAEFIADPSALAGHESLVTTHVPHAFPPAVRPAGHPVSKVLHPPVIPPVRQRHYGLSHTRVAFR